MTVCISVNTVNELCVSNKKKEHILMKGNNSVKSRFSSLTQVFLILVLYKAACFVKLYKGITAF